MNRFLRLLVFFTALISFQVISIAGQFDSAVDVIGIKANGNYTHNDWSAAEKFKGVKWKWSYYESGAHDPPMVGTAKFGNSKNPNIGVTDIRLNGPRVGIAVLEITIWNAGENPSPKAVNNMFGPGKVKVIKTNCEDDSVVNPSATYQFEKVGYKPVIINYVASSGSGGGMVGMKLGNSLGDISDTCKAIK